MMRGGCAPRLLTHVNLLLTLYGGATLATAARLKWDPSTYIAVRELFPAEYRALAAVTAVYGFTLLLLPHLAGAALHTTTDATRRILLYIYAVAMLLVIVGEVVFVSWFTHRILAWLESEAAVQMQEAMELREHFKPILQYFSRFHPLPEKIELIIKEAEEDAPRNMYAAAAAALLLLILEPLSIVLALCAARQANTSSTTHSSVLAKHRYSPASSTYSELAQAGEKAPLKTTYKNGRIVVM